MYLYVVCIHPIKILNLFSPLSLFIFPFFYKQSKKKKIWNLIKCVCILLHPEIKYPCPHVVPFIWRWKKYNIKTFEYGGREYFRNLFLSNFIITTLFFQYWHFWEFRLIDKKFNMYHSLEWTKKCPEWKSTAYIWLGWMAQVQSCDFIAKPILNGQVNL